MSPTFLLDYLHRTDGNKPSHSFKTAIIGGGRWAKILCKTFTRIGNVSSIEMVSPKNYSHIRDWIGSELDDVSAEVTAYEKIDSVLKNENINAVFVANSPADHYNTALQLLHHNKNVMVEKPFVTTAEQAERLIAVAKEKNLLLAVGHEFNYASYFHYFKSLVERENFKTSSITFHWHDLKEEKRWGFNKTPDLSTNLVIDLFPHILSILEIIFGKREIINRGIDLIYEGTAANIELLYGHIPVHISISRNNNPSKRLLELKSPDGNSFSIDFTKEPGMISNSNQSFPSDPEWDKLPRPLEAEISLFLEGINDIRIHSLIFAENSREIFKATFQAQELILKCQRELLKSYLLQEKEDNITDSAIIALKEHIVNPLFYNGLTESPKDEEQLNFWTKKILKIIYKLSNFPFTTQQEILLYLKLKKEELVALNNVMRSSSFIQELIIKGGVGNKYWQNTIIPLIQSGIVDNYLEGVYNYPYRTGIYPGVSCMFFCTFCGRNPDAKYDYKVIHSGNEYFKSLFDEAPKSDPYRFYISGGLEPLTNPGIGSVISYGRSKGFMLSLYTNAYMLTPQLLSKQPGIWDLNILRVSIYGVDDKTMEDVTKNKNAYHQVVKNVTSFLRLRNELNSPLKIGMNFVVLPGCAGQVLELAELIAKINIEAGGGRQIDFLTLREDYSNSPNGTISAGERKKLSDVFNKFMERVKSEDLSELHVDYGYSLNALLLGNPTTNLEKVEYYEMRRNAYPQISVVTDLNRDIYAYREAGFLDREGADRYIIGRSDEYKSMGNIAQEFIENKTEIKALEGDTAYFDIFDHVVTKLINKVEADYNIGFPHSKGPIKDLIYSNLSISSRNTVSVGHPTLIKS